MEMKCLLLTSKHFVITPDYHCYPSSLRNCSSVVGRFNNLQDHRVELEALDLAVEEQKEVLEHMAVEENDVLAKRRALVDELDLFDNAACRLACFIYFSIKITFCINNTII